MKYLILLVYLDSAVINIIKMSAKASTREIPNTVESECACVIESLIRKPFSARTNDEKKEIL